MLAVFIGCAASLGAVLSYLLSAAYGHVDWCVPFWESCSSISKAGRKPPAFFVFKAFFLPVAGLMLHRLWRLPGPLRPPFTNVQLALSLLLLMGGLAWRTSGFVLSPLR